MTSGGFRISQRGCANPRGRVARLLFGARGRQTRVPRTPLDPPLMAHIFVISISFRSFPEKYEIYLSAFVICACPADREDVNALKNLYLFILIETETSAEKFGNKKNRSSFVCLLSQSFFSDFDKTNALADLCGEPPRESSIHHCNEYAYRCIGGSRGTARVHFLNVHAENLAKLYVGAPSLGQSTTPYGECADAKVKKV